MKYSYLYILFALIGGLASCTERVDIDLEEAGEARLIVFGELTNEPKVHEIRLSRSAAYFSNQAPSMILNAQVMLDDGEEAILLTEDEQRPGVYLTPATYHGVVGRQYRLDISNVDANEDGEMETYWAKTEMKPYSEVEGVAVVYNSDWEGWEVGVFGQDNPDVEDYYLFKVYKNGELYTDSLHNYWVIEDRFFNGSAINGPIVQYFDEEKGELVEKGDTITLEMAAITEEYYTFINGAKLETNEKIPLFSGPSANLKGNISDGALGFFAAYGLSRGSTIYQGEVADK